MEPKEWLAAVSSLQPLFPSDLAWLTLSDRRRILSVAKECIKDALTQFFPSREHIAEDDLKPALDPFVTWLESSSDDDILRFSWDLIAWRTQLGWTDSWYPVRRMERSGRLAGAISREHIETAVTIVEEAHCIRSWPKNRWQFVHWDSHAETYFKSLEDPSYLVRAASAHALGALLCGCHSEGNGCGAPTGSEMLDFVQKQEQKRPRRCRPFPNRSQLAGIHIRQPVAHANRLRYACLVFGDPEIQFARTERSSFNTVGILGPRILQLRRRRHRRDSKHGKRTLGGSHCDRRA